MSCYWCNLKKRSWSVSGASDLAMNVHERRHYNELLRGPLSVTWHCVLLGQKGVCVEWGRLYGDDGQTFLHNGDLFHCGTHHCPSPFRAVSTTSRTTFNFIVPATRRQKFPFFSCHSGCSRQVKKKICQTSFLDRDGKCQKVKVRGGGEFIRGLWQSQSCRSTRQVSRIHFI